MNDSNVLDGDNFESQQPKKNDPGRGKKKAVKGPLKYEEAQAAKILTKSDCLSGLSQLPGLLAMKLVAPAQANAMSRVYSTLLQYEKDEAMRSNQAGLSQPTLIETLRKNSDLINQIAPLLTKEQFDYLVREIQGLDNA
jgi:hypothetical protein